MATVRVFLPTYRRPQLLARALESLRRQTFTDWICELHNDAPEDDAPIQLLERLRDSRFIYQPHPRNLGGTATFNLFFRATSEPFYAMLEDDNAWSPEFLATMLATARLHPDVTVFWANQQIWQQEADGTMRDTGRTVHPWREGEAPRRIAWAQTTQVAGAMHAHGALLVRSRPGVAFATPPVPIALVEAFRERMYPHPLVYVPQPLGCFSVTRQSARSDDRTEWATLQAMLAATFLKHAALDESQIASLWREARSRNPPGTTTLLLAGLMDRQVRPVLRRARLADWLLFLRGAVRRPALFWNVLHSRRRHPDWWEFLEQQTANRFAESRRTP